MSELERTKSVQYFFDALKVILPFAAAMWAIFAIQGESNEERAMMREHIREHTEKITELYAEQELMRAQMHQNAIDLTEVKSDLKYIKDDTKETLDLVRAYIGRGRN
jgi:hypothetical protein